MTTIFIDGESGTTGLRLRERIANRADLKLISLPADERRSPDARLEAMKAADVTVLCLPDDAAREAVKLADEAGTRVLDASSAHRTAPEWVYGMPELMNGRAAEIARASRVSVPGCHASGFILLVAPLVSAGIIAPDAFLSATSVTGYSGGGKKMISAYETAGRTAFDSLAMPLPYAHSQTHKHLPEMTIAAGLAARLPAHRGEFPLRHARDGSTRSWTSRHDKGDRSVRLGKALRGFPRRAPRRIRVPS